MTQHLSQLAELHAQANEMLAQARRDEYDYQQQFLAQYHAMEIMGPLNAAEGYRVYKTFQATLIGRRQAKWDVDTLEKLTVALNACEFARYVTRATDTLTRTQRTLERTEAEAERYLREGPARPAEAAD